MTTHAVPPLVEVQPLPSIDTTRLFRPAGDVWSPIDKFIANTNAINVILTGATADRDPTPELSSVVVLGYLSAVETYFRTLLSRLAHIDDLTMEALGQKQLLFSVAMKRPRETLAEALYEDSFASLKELKARLGEIGMKPLPGEIDTALETYERICHVRHCCVHRFGYLGNKNANDLGISKHHHLIGGLFSASTDDLADIADALQVFVKTCNNHIFRFIIDRTVTFQNDPNHEFEWDWKWSWKYKTDKKHFKSYYDLFALVEGRPASLPMKDAYKHFKDSNAKKVADMTARLNAAIAVPTSGRTPQSNPD
ncbi:hypothetical protein [Mesorhizobium sp.]|uniref:hypothetical protein n=1 Tax=Mesorhizobium sp. TaxID=1871066 RepID=UPI000FE65C32|nr:hypothetical protein [Mesorhizobium sp.]RWE28612.1 MAG: hypothetical protein EOS77_25490 [Mesorhizobium sp.]